MAAPAPAGATTMDPAPAGVVAAAATARVAASLDGPARVCPVLATGDQAVYVRDDHTCLAVLGRDAVAVPCGLRTRLSLLPHVDSVELGHGRCVVGEHEIVVGRLVEAGVAFVGSIDPDAWPVGRDQPALDAVRGELPTSALARLTDADPAAVPQLLGRGSGLTPVGDDVLAGWLVTRHATGTVQTPVVDAVRSGAPARTTPVSAALLSDACAGEAIPALRDLLLALRADTHRDQQAALDHLVGVGHTSGAGLALGARLALLGQPVRRAHP